MKTRAPRDPSTKGQLAYNIGLRCPKDMKLAIERMAKLLDRSENSCIIECVMAIDNASKVATEKEAMAMSKIVYMLRQSTEFLSRSTSL